MTNNHALGVLSKLRSELSQSVDAHTKDTAQRFFKEQIKVYGIKTAVVMKISKKYFETINNLGKSQIFELCENLFLSGYMEESFIACNWAYNLNKSFEKNDFY